MNTTKIKITIQLAETKNSSNGDVTETVQIDVENIRKLTTEQVYKIEQCLGKITTKLKEL